MASVRTWGDIEHVLTAGTTARANHPACIDLTTGLLHPAGARADLLFIGFFKRDVEGNGTRKAGVWFLNEKHMMWVPNDTANPVTASDIGSNCFFAGADLVSSDGTGRSVAGQVWAVNADKGVLIEGVRS